MPARKIDTSRVAERRGQWVRLGVAGAPSSGKTRTGLWLAFELAGPDGRVLVIDTEVTGPPEYEGGPCQVGSELFAEHFPQFTPYHWPEPFTPSDLGDTLVEAAGDFDVIVVDSLSHFWEAEGGTLSIKDAVDREGTFRNNKGAAWSVATPEQERMVRGIQNARCHIVLCMRAKKVRDMSTMEVVGVSERQRPEFSHELTLAVHLDEAHRIEVTKSRIDAGGFTIPVGAKYELSEHQAFADELTGWLGSAVTLAGGATPAQLAEIADLFESIPTDGNARAQAKQAFVAEFGVTSPNQLTEARAGEAVEFVRGLVPQRKRKPTPGRKVAKKTVKTGGAKKATRRAVSDSEAPGGSDGESPVETPGGAENGSGAVSGDAEGVSVERKALFDLYLGLDGPIAVEVQSELEESGWFPIDEIPEEQVGEALELAHAAFAELTEATS